LSGFDCTISDYFLLGFYAYYKVLLLVIVTPTHWENHMSSIRFTNFHISIFFSEQARALINISFIAASSKVCFYMLFALFLHSQGFGCF
jgi:hypothetical protein